MKTKTAISFLWSLNSKLAMVVFEFFTQLVLARLLFPKDFGIIAIVMVFISFGRAITNAGLSQALIQKKSPNIVEESSVFYFNLLIGVTFTAIIFMSSGFISEYYSQPILKAILRTISFWFIINALSIIHDVRLTKDLNFKAKFYVNIIAVFISSVLSISLAFMGFGVWALVIQLMTAQFIRTLLLWKYTSWKPLMIFEWSVLRKLFPFGLNILLSSIFTGFRINIFAIVIGKAYTTTQLGFYNRANQLQNITSKTFTTSLQNVLFPVFSELQDNIDLLRKGLKKSLKYLFFIITPLMIFFMINAEDIIVILLTDKWIESATYLKLLSMLGIIYPLQMMNLNALKAINLSKKFLYMTLLWDILSILSAILTSFYSIEIMILGQLATTLLCFAINVKINGRHYGYLLKDQIKDLLPLILINISLYIILSALFSVFPDLNIYLSMSIKVIISCLMYVLLVYLSYRTFFKEVITEFKSLTKNKN